MKVLKSIKDILFCLLLLGLVILVTVSCSPWDGSSGDEPETSPPTAHMLRVRELSAILPARTRGAMALDLKTLLAGDAAADVMGLLNGNGTDAALNELFSKVGAYTFGMEISRWMETALLVQTTDAQGGFILLAKLNHDLLAEVIDITGLTESPLYKSHRIYTDPAMNLSVALLPEGLFIAGQATSIQSLIDVHEGDAASAASGAEVGAYLEDLAMFRAVSFVYGLPALYKTITSGITLKGSQAVTIGLDFSAGMLSGEAYFYTGNAAEFASIYNEATELYGQQPLTAYPASSDKIACLKVPIPDSAINKSAEEIISSRHELKMLYYIMAARDVFTGVATGESMFWKTFFVENTPPSVFINFEIPPEQVAAFSEAVLPAGFEMTPLKILESDTSAYFLSLNVYTVSGLVSGVRQEWSVFVKDPLLDKPRFLVIQALAEDLSADPTVEDFYTYGDPVDFREENGLLVIESFHDQGSGSENYFSASITWPQASPTWVQSSREFVTANDLICWGGGVCDHALYNGDMYNRNLTLIPPGDYNISNDTPWAQYVNAIPRSVYAYQNDLDILVAPWWNLDADYLDLSAERIAVLKEHKASSYNRIGKTDIFNAFYAKDEAITINEADNTLPALFFNYLIPDSSVDDFQAALGLPAGYTLEKTRILESDAQEAHYLTLNVYQLNDAPEGTRAEWSVYVDDGNGREHFMIIDLMTEDAAMDPVSLLNLPSVVEHDLSGDSLTTRLVSSNIEFNATLNISEGVEDLQTLDWVEARDFVCYLNGVCDMNYVGEGSLETPLFSVDPALVTSSLSSPWSAYIESEPSSVLFRNNKQLFANKAWYNVQ